MYVIEFQLDLEGKFIHVDEKWRCTVEGGDLSG